MNDERNDYTIPKYNRIRGGLNAVFTRPTSFKVVQETVGLSETYTIETGRDESGDHCFVERVDENTTVTRIYLPPKVLNAIQRQRDSLTARARSRRGKEAAQARKDRGELPGFMRKKGVGA
jgi:hypothetical protein